MRLVTFAKGDVVSVGVSVDGAVAPVDAPDLISFVQADDFQEAAQAAVDRAQRGGGLVRPDRLLAPVPRPGKILNVELNYPSILKFEPDDDFPPQPRIFAKLTNAVIGQGAPIEISRPELKVDYEVELAVVIGKTARRVRSSDAFDYILGYTILNDVAARDVQLEQDNTLFAKGMDTFCPLGPEIVLPDEIPDPRALTIRSYVNGALRQEDSIANLHFSIPDVIEYVTETITLEPGDVVSTGTPAGVGLYQDPPSYLRPGDQVTVEVDKIGRLTNPVISAWEPS
jgi:2-keto-4-pentenoate hydratase/2-oxohepta-3-ene-1,7-dioic acid hydratase in catechol pathway